MNEFLIYILKSTLCMSGLYLVFRTLMRKQTYFQLNRLILLWIVVFSTIIPLVNLPQTMQPAFSFQLAPVAKQIDLSVPEFSGEMALIGNEVVVPPMEATSWQLAIPWFHLLKIIYLSGLFVALLASLIGFLNILILFRKVPVISEGGFRLLIAPNDIPAFSLGKYLFISKNDFETNGGTILTHEQAHVRHGHFYDLLLLELVKIIYWFNPAIYLLIRDLKAIHEFQADDSTLNNGIDATQYQLLIIQKCVGHQKFALANSFNHCQIKNRIVMMNKQKTSKAWRWMAAAFIPILALLLMAFGRTGEKVSEKRILPENVTTLSGIIQKQNEQFSQKIEIKKDGNYIDNKLCSLEEIVKQAQEWKKANNVWIPLLIDVSIPFNRIDEVREALANAKVYHVTQTTVNSDDIVYFAGDVSDMAEFSQGKWSAWITSQLNNFPEAKSKAGNYDITYCFIIGKNGKVRDGHVIKGCDNPEMNAAYEKILTQIPDWEPAMRGSAKVSVYKIIGVRAYSPPKK